MRSGSWAISRRTVLRGIGAAIALPLLDIMGGKECHAGVPAPGGGSYKPTRNPVRLLMINLPNGTLRKEWGVAPEAKGKMRLLPLLAPFEPLGSDISIISNLWNEQGDLLSHKFNMPHILSEANLWTCTTMPKPSGLELNVGGVSVDQVIAQHTAQVTRVPSLHLGMVSPQGGLNDGWPKALCGQLSWSSPTTPVPNELDPKRAFDRLFRGIIPDPGQAAEASPATAEEKGSILDLVLADAREMGLRGSVADRRRLDEYLTAVREVEKRIAKDQAEEKSARRVDPQAITSATKYRDVLASWEKLDRTARARAMLDLIVLAFWTDATRVASFMFDNERTNAKFSFLPGVTHGYHEASHWNSSKETETSYRAINLWCSENVAYVVKRMKDIKEASGGSLLDNSVVFWASAIHDGRNHKRHNIPLLLAGRGGGRFKAGQHVVCPEKTPLANLFLTMIQTMGIRQTRFADSTGPLTQLVKA